VRQVDHLQELYTTECHFRCQQIDLATKKI